MDEAGSQTSEKVCGTQAADAIRKVFQGSAEGKPIDGVQHGPLPPPLPQPPSVRLLQSLLGANATPQEILQLGPFIDSLKANSDNDGVHRLDGKQHVVAFPERLVLLFGSLDADRVQALSALADWSPEIIGTLHRLGQAEIERLIKKQLWIRAWKATGAGAVFAFGVAKWGWEVWQWFSGNFPGISEALTWLSGSVK